MSEMEQAAEMRNRRLNTELHEIETWGNIHLANHMSRPGALCPLCFTDAGEPITTPEDAQR